MVTAMAMNERSEAGGITSGWLPLFVAVSILINLGIAHAASNFSVPEIVVADPPPLRINLSVRAAPPITPSAGGAAPRAASPKALMSVETTATAVEKIAAIAPEPVPKTAPVKIVKPQPKMDTARLSTKPSRTQLDVPIPKTQNIAAAKPTPNPIVEKDVSSPPDRTSSQIETPMTDAGASSATIQQEARYRRQTPPVYPRRAYELGQQGTVLLFAQVLPNGRPGELKVAQSSGHSLLDMSALAAVRAWEFEPFTINGSEVATWVRVPVRFVIQ